ncbi:MAG: beta-ketoacyl-[acyl-carrier-protein] synthase family protein [Thermomicrobiales bacterium]
MNDDHNQSSDAKSKSRLFTRPSLAPRRVVVTGLGAISSLGGNVADFWRSLLDGKTGIKRQEQWDPAVNTCVLHGNVPDEFVQQRFLDPKSARNTSRFSKMALEAAGDALIDAGLVDPETYEPTADLSAGGAYLGTCVGGTYDDLLPAYDTFKERGPSRVPVHLHVKFPHNLAAFMIQNRWGMGGPSTTIATACATGAQAIGQAFHDIKYGRAPLMVAGAVESDYDLMFVTGFAAMKALCTDSNDEPEKASRPFDATRAGFILGEGAGMLVLEDYEHAVNRGADIYAEISGFATSNDAYHLIAPKPDGTGAARAINWALEDAGLEPDDIGYINAHAASTPAGDVSESEAIKVVYGERASDIPVNSIKGAIGHCMGASGALETVSAILAVASQSIPPTLNYRNPDPEIGLDIVADEPRKASFRHVAKHSFGLGGQNACLIISEAPERAKAAPAS